MSDDQPSGGGEAEGEVAAGAEDEPLAKIFHDYESDVKVSERW